jgi:twitching motility protein PilU
VHAIKELMAKSKEMGMQTFDQALYDLYEAGDVSYEDALRNADSMSELKLAIKLNSKRARAADAEGKPKVELSLHEEKKEEEAPAEMFTRPAPPMPAPAVQAPPNRPAA